MKYLLDTCVVSEVLKKKSNRNVVNWLSSVGDHALYLSVVTLGEIRKGIAKVESIARKKELQSWLSEDLCNRFEGRILGIDLKTAFRWGELQGGLELRGTKMPVIDGLIAATALTHDLVIVTRNVGDMKFSGAQVFNPWE